MTFSVYSDKRGTEKILPICLVPAGDRRGGVGPGRDGAAPADAALSAFLDDIYGEQLLIKAGLVPRRI